MDVRVSVVVLYSNVVGEEDAAAAGDGALVVRGVILMELSATLEGAGGVEAAAAVGVEDVAAIEAEGAFDTVAEDATGADGTGGAEAAAV